MTSILTRGIENVLPSKEALEKELQDKTLSIYYGIDPTGPDLHLGHLANFLVLKRFIKEGHKATILFGDFTARIGDPSGKDVTRKPLTEKEIKANFKTYKDQIKRVFGKEFGKLDFKNNSEWLEKLDFQDVLNLASNITVQQMIERDMFQRRLKEGSPIGLDEFLYPLMQGYDSYALKTDIELGGNDQLFNMMMGRTLETVLTNGEKSKFVVAIKLLADSDSGKKMSKSEGFYVPLNTDAKDMFGKVMRIPDNVVLDCFELCTEIDMEEVNKMASSDIHPKELKSKLSFEITKLVYGEDQAIEAQREFESVFSEGNVPEDIKEIKINEVINIIDLILKAGLAESKSEVRRLIEGKGVEMDGQAITDWNTKIQPGDKGVLKVGKRRFVKIK